MLFPQSCPHKCLIFIYIIVEILLKLFYNNHICGYSLTGLNAGLRSLRLGVQVPLTAPNQAFVIFLFQALIGVSAFIFRIIFFPVYPILFFSSTLLLIVVLLCFPYKLSQTSLLALSLALLNSSFFLLSEI